MSDPESYTPEQQIDARDRMAVISEKLRASTRSTGDPQQSALVEAYIQQHKIASWSPPATAPSLETTRTALKDHLELRAESRENSRALLTTEHGSLEQQLRVDYAEALGSELDRRNPTPRPGEYTDDDEAREARNANLTSMEYQELRDALPDRTRLERFNLYFAIRDAAPRPAAELEPHMLQKLYEGWWGADRWKARYADAERAWNALPKGVALRVLNPRRADRRLMDTLADLGQAMKR